MKYLFSLLSILFFSTFSFASSNSTAGTVPEPVIIVIPMEGTVDASMASFLSRALRDSRQYPDRVIVLEMDTFGGQVDAAFQIVDTLLNTKAPIISYVKTKAISAGALIALAGNKLTMKNGTTIGDVAPLTMSNEGPQMLGEKYQSPIRAKFRTLAKRNNYPETLTESMVTADMMVYEVKFSDTTLYLDSTDLADLNAARKKQILSSKTVVRKGELLTMDDVEARRLGFSKMSVPDLDQMLSEMGYKDAKIIRISQNWSEKLVRLIGTLSPILLMIGFAALYIEIRSPGFGVPGILGIACLATVFLSQYIIGLADFTELLLLAIGIVLLAVEIFVIPGFGLVGIAGIALMMIGAVLSFQGFVIPKPEFPWQARTLTHNMTMVVGSIIGSVALIVVFFRYGLVYMSSFIKGPYLNATLQEARLDNEGMEGLPRIGDDGVVVSPLRPSGKVRIKDNVLDVIADGEFIDKGISIMISEISGNRIKVIRKQES